MHKAGYLKFFNLIKQETALPKIMKQVKYMQHWNVEYTQH